MSELVPDLQDKETIEAEEKNKEQLEAIEEQKKIGSILTADCAAMALSLRVMAPSWPTKGALGHGAGAVGAVGRWNW